MGWKMPRGRPSFSISASSQSLLSAPTSAVVLAFVYSLAGTPQSR